MRNPNYVPRSEPPSGLAGSKKGHFDRVEWLYLPDSNSAVAALKKGEVDMIEQVPADYIAPLRSDPNVKVFSGGTQQAQLVMNHLHPPFDNPKVRQALLKAVSQERFDAAMGYPLDMRMRYCATFFICGSPNDTAAGADPYRTADVARARQMLAESGYKGEKVMLLVTERRRLPERPGAGDRCRRCAASGINVDGVTMDWSSIGARRARKTPCPRAGGWSAYATVANEFAINSADRQRLPERGLRQHPAWLALRQAARRAAQRRGSSETGAREAQASARRLPGPRLRNRAVHQPRPVSRQRSPRAPASRAPTSSGPACPTVWVLDK